MSVQSFIKIERGSDRAHDYKLKKVPLFVIKPVNVNALRSAALQLAVVPANRITPIYSIHMLMSVPSFESSSLLLHNYFT